MKAARESVMTVVPFTVGVAIVKYSQPWFYTHYFWMVAALSTAFAGIFALAFALLRGAVRPKNFLLYLMFFLAGAAVCLLSGLPLGAEGGLVGTGLNRFAARCGGRFREMIGGIPFGDRMTNALMKALLAGDRSGLGRDVRTSFREAGASHLLALSGLHLSVIYLIFSRLLSVTGNSPVAVRIRSVLIILGSGFFTLMTGASPSLVRAFLFILLRESALILRRPTDNISIFLTALMLQLALNPNDIASVGFQLSYLAMLGIFLIYPPLEKLWDRAGDWLRTGSEKNKCPVEDKGVGGKDGNVESVCGEGDMSVEKNIVSDGLADGGQDSGKDKGWGRAFGAAMRKVWSLCALTISCQVFTAPAVFLYFGTFPRYFLITNLFCLPLSNVLITLMVIVALLHPLGLCPAFLLSLTDFLVRALLYILDTISTM